MSFISLLSYSVLWERLFNFKDSCLLFNSEKFFASSTHHSVYPLPLEIVFCVNMYSLFSSSVISFKMLISIFLSISNFSLLNIQFYLFNNCLFISYNLPFYIVVSLVSLFLKIFKDTQHPKLFKDFLSLFSQIENLLLQIFSINFR